MEQNKNRVFAVILVSLLTVIAGAVLFYLSRPVKIDVLIIPKFEIGALTGDAPGEAQLFYEEYCIGAKTYPLKNKDGNPLYVKDGVAMVVGGMGKVNAAANLTELLEDERFDLSEAYILSTGCGGGPYGVTVPGDVVIATAVVDFDLGHHADPREMENSNRSKWFHEAGFDSFAVKILNSDLVDKIYDNAADIQLSSAESYRSFLVKETENAAWASRTPCLLKGTAVTGDNYWKGEYDQSDAELMCAYYKCPDPYAMSEMEDIALALVADKYGLLDRFISLRAVVDLTWFVGGTTPESLWLEDQTSISSEENQESLDAFEVGMKNVFEIGKKTISMLRTR